ncbi:MAG: DUF2625 domain-containing protein [Prevotella sp.]|jgi:hypothetical protein|nr:DUF2625 domain-containing protein [Prevotella sp.]
MRTLQELVNTDEPGWPIIKEWIDLAKNKVEILPCELQRAENALINTQVTTRSLMGAIIYNTGGLLIDNGWIRILGSGSDRMKRTLPDWNIGKTFSEFGEPAPYLLVADDAIGGFYAINGGFFGQDMGNMYYFAPDMLKWIPMEIGYSQFLLFCFETNMNDFYAGLRWNNWQNDIENLHPDYTYSFYPFLWTKEGVDINKVHKEVVPAEEAYNFNMDSMSTVG